MASTKTSGAKDSARDGSLSAIKDNISTAHGPIVNWACYFSLLHAGKDVRSTIVVHNSRIQTSEQ
jgi:hypothetical protein